MRSLDTPKRRMVAALLIIACGVSVAYFVNSLLPSTGNTAGGWMLLDPIPRQTPTGSDFFNGLYTPAQVLLRTGNPYTLRLYSYPPLPAALAVPVSLLSYQTAYTVHVVSLLLAVLLSMLVAVDAARIGLAQVFPASKRTLDQAALFVGAMITFQMISGYGFAFALERGNFDAFALLLSVLAVWFMAKDPPGAALVSVVLIAAAANLKVYPLILFAVVVWRYGWRWLGPLAAASAAFLLITGPANAMRAAARVYDGVGNGIGYWVGNHSAMSFATVLEGWGIARGVSGPILVLVPTLVWIAGAILLFRTRRSPAGVVAFFALSVPIMCVIPSVSHDYKLILLYPLLAFLLMAATVRFADRFSPANTALLAGVVVIAGLVSRSPALKTGLLLRNKYPAIIVLEIVVLLLIVTGIAVSRTGDDDAKNAPPRPRSGGRHRSSTRRGYPRPDSRGAT